MFDDFKTFMSRRDLIAVTVGLLAALALFSFLDALVSAVIAPLLAIVVNQPTIDALNTRIGGADFYYGGLIVATLLLVAALATIYLLATLTRETADPD